MFNCASVLLNVITVLLCYLVAEQFINMVFVNGFIL